MKISTKLTYSALALVGCFLADGLTQTSSAAVLTASTPTEFNHNARITLVHGGGDIMPTQRSRYLSMSAGAENSHFGANAGSPNAWGRTRITPDEGIVTLRPGESYQRISI